MGKSLAKGAHQRVGWQKAEPVIEIDSTIGNEFLPGGTAKGMLQLGHTFAPGVVEYFSKHGVVGYSHFRLLFLIRDMDHFNGV